MNLSYDLIKQVKTNSCIDSQIYLCSFRWPNICMVKSISLLSTELAYSLSVSVNKCDVTDALLPHGAAEVKFQSVQPRT